MNLQKRIACISAATLLFSIPASSSQRLDEALNLKGTETSEVVEETTEDRDEVTQEASTTEPRWVGANFTANESKALEFFQDYGITDRAALATILGNIKQESKFNSNICEGGARIQYESCHRGGYGMIQWTTSFRYWGLGNFAKLNNCSASNFDCQLGYLVTEREWKESMRWFGNKGQSIPYYMKGAYRWLGWGIHGARSSYSYQYYDALSLTT